MLNRARRPCALFGMPAYRFQFCSEPKSVFGHQEPGVYIF